MLEAIDAARGGFTMVELGAGYGRWVVDAWNAMRRKGLENLPLRLVAVEAEPQHFRWMQEHFRNNGLDPAQHRLIEAAVAGKPGTVTFSTGHAGAWYGQAIVKTDRIEHADYPEARVIQVPALTLEQVLEGIEAVDLLDMDIQGAELDVCTAGMPTLLRKVRRVHIGTHGDAIDTGLRRLFRAHGWRNLHDYPNGRANRTPFGVIMFGDGVQSWVNPQLA
jgi:FkbM family methyltransferase